MPSRKTPNSRTPPPSDVSDYLIKTKFVTFYSIEDKNRKRKARKINVAEGGLNKIMLQRFD